MKKKLLAFLITFGVMIAGTASASLWSFYNGNLPSIAERTPIAQEAGISNYTGTYSQNIALEAYLRGGMEVLGATPTPTSSAAIKYVEAPDFYAYSPAVAGDTTITINNLTDIYGNKLTMADFGNIGYGRIDPDGAEVSESFTFTGVTANSDGTYTLTGVKSVLAKYPYTQTSGLVRSHSINAIVRFTNTASFYDNFANKENNEIIDGSWSFLNNTFSIGDGANTNKTFKFNNGATNTPEMVYDATNNQLKFRRSGETSYTEIPLSLRGTYANYASLPTDASNGDIAITTDDYKLYTYNATGATWVLAGGSSGAGTVYKTEKLGSESDGGDLKTFTLTAGSWPSSNFLLVYKNGQLQRIGATYDYTEVDSNTIEFTYELATDDLVSMIVVSVDLYNPAWGVVNGSIIPDTDNAYDIGSSSKQFKDIYLEGDLIKDGVAATSTPTANAIPVADGSGKLDSGWLPFGDGSDGILEISSGTTTIDLNSSAYVEKNYTSISITGTGSLAFINPHSLGSVIVLKSIGNVVITSSATNAIDLRELGSTGATTNNVFDAIDHRAKTIYSNSYFYTLPNNANSFNRQVIVVTPGTQGAAGQNDTGSAGKGAGGLIIKCGGNLNFTGVINASGKDGANGVGADTTGAGGGSGSDVVIAYKGTLIASSGTINNAGGKGGNGGTYAGTPRLGGDGAGSSSGTGGAGISNGTPNAGGIKAGGGGAGVASSGSGTGGSGGTSDGGLIIKITD